MSAAADAEDLVLRDSRSPEVRRATEDQELIECVDRALGILQGKWKVHLLFVMARGIHRHSRLLDCLPGVSKKVMTESLRALERDGLVQRTIFAEVPVRVEYALTGLGWSMTGPMIALGEWGSSHATEVNEARTRSNTAGLANGRAPLAAA